MKKQKQDKIWEEKGKGSGLSIEALKTFSYFSVKPNILFINPQYQCKLINSLVLLFTY